MPDDPTFSADSALIDPADDKLQRDKFCSEIAKSLGSWKGNESLIVSICGEWGSGKTTIRNFVSHYLSKDYPQVHLVDFNPWEWSGQDKLLEGFLWQIGQAFGKVDRAKWFRKLSRTWKVYASILRFGGEIGASVQRLVTFLLAAGAGSAIAGNFLENWVGNLLILFAIALLVGAGTAPLLMDRIARFLEDWSLLKETSLDDLRTEVADELAKLEAPVIVFIDDIDRLTDTEIKLLIQLVKANVHFPKLIYVLLFQRDIVAKALGKITSDDGNKYLRKIVQVEFDVPAASDDQAKRILTEGLNQVLNTKDILVRMEEEEQERWRHIFHEDLWPYFRNLRDIKRFLGSFHFYFNLQVNNDVLEVNPIDLIAIEVLRVFDPEVYIHVSRSFLRRRNAMAEWLLDQKELSEQFSLQVDAIADGPPGEDAKRLKHLLQELFPQAREGNADEEHEWNRRLRVCHRDHFPKYFQATFEAGRPTAGEFRAFIKLAKDRERLVKTLQAMIGNGTLHAFLKFLLASRKDVPLEAVGPTITALSDVADEIPRAEGFFGEDDAIFEINRFTHHRLISEPPETRAELLLDAYERSQGIIGPSKFLITEDEPARAEHSEIRDFIIPLNSLPRFKTLIVDRIRRSAEDDQLLSNPYCGYLLYRWRDWGDASEVKKWGRKVTQSPGNALRLLPHLMSRSSTGGKIEPFLNGEAVESILELEPILSAIETADERSWPDDTQLQVSLLRRSIKLKDQKKPYSEVRPKGSMFY